LNMTQTALRWSGAAQVAVGLLIVPGAVLAMLQARGQISFAGLSFLIVVVPALFMLALQGVYARQAGDKGNKKEVWR
jgi:flagellar biosynthesis protein FliQ